MTSPTGLDQVHVVGLPGSLSDTSYTRMTVRLALEGAEDAGATTDLIDLRELELPFCDGSDDEDYPEDVFALRERVGRADGIILGTPEYHGGYSGVLKNALDLMGFDEFEGKMLGLVAVSGGSMGGLAPMNALRDVGRALHAWVVPSQAGIPRAWEVFEEEGRLGDDRIADRVRQVGQEVVRFARLHGAEDALSEFVARWEGAQPNPGGQGR